MARIFFLIFALVPSAGREDGDHSFKCNKEETGRPHPLLISLAQTLEVGSASLPPPKVIR